MMAGLIDALDRGRDRRSGARRAAARRGRALLRRRRHRGPQRAGWGPAPDRQHPTPAPDAGPPPDPARRSRRRSRWCARCRVGRPGSASSSRSPPICASPATTPGSGSRSASGGSRPTAARRGCCRAGSARCAPASCSCSAGRCRARRPRRGARSTGRCRPRALAGEVDMRGRTARGRARRSRSGSRSGSCTRARSTTLADQLANEAFALELSSRTEDFREGLAAFRDKRPPEFTGR